MAYSLSNYGQAPMGSGDNYNNYRLILRPELRKSWYVYATRNGTQFRPYPVFDAQGNPCSPAGQETDNPIDLLPECFAALKIVLFAGINKNLEFINYCSDLSSYILPGREDAYTPYDYLYNACRRMLPMKSDRSRTPDGFPTPRALTTMEGMYGIARSTNAIICRGMLITHNGAPLTVAAAQNTGGVLFTAVIAITQKGCCDNLMSLLKRVDLNKPLAGDNVMLGDMLRFKAPILSIKTSSGGRAGEQGKAELDRHQVTPDLLNIMGSAMGAVDDASYWGALRSAFGPAQAIGDIFNIMTAKEMVEVLKETHPISWVWYALKDSPYADFVTPEERQKAMADPEMSARFGVEPPQQVTHNPFNAGAGMNAGFPKTGSAFNSGLPAQPPVYTPTPAPVPAPNWNTDPATAPVSGPNWNPAPTPTPAPGPNWNPAPVGGGSIDNEEGIQRPAQSPFPGAGIGSSSAGIGASTTIGGSVPSAAPVDGNDALARLNAKYKGMEPGNVDGIKY